VATSFTSTLMKTGLLFVSDIVAVSSFLLQTACTERQGIGSPFYMLMLVAVELVITIADILSVHRNNRYMPNGQK
jgi:hypothetical protein